MAEDDDDDTTSPPAPMPPPSQLAPPTSSPAAPLVAPSIAPSISPRRHRTWLLVAVSVAALLVVAAGATAVVLIVGGDESAAGVTCPGADGRTRELRRCLSESLAFVETPVATGSGVLLDNGYVVTNAHVIDPYGIADVTFDGGDTFEQVTVVGVDAFADIAVLGPLDTERTGIELVPIPDFAEVEEPDVFLAGYPGGVESNDPGIALSSGLMSRARRDEAFDHTYLQTDAPIAAGQSGGALVDDQGRVLGISGLGFADQFALALSTDDVIDAVSRIRSGDGDDRRTMPALDEASAEAVTVDLSADQPSRVVVLPPVDQQRTVRLSVEPGATVGIEVANELGEVIGINDVARRLAEDSGFFDQQVIDEFAPLEGSGSDSFEFDAFEAETVFITIRRVGADESVAIDVDVPFVVHDDTIAGEAVTVGRPLRGVLDGFAFEALHPVELTDGDEITIAVNGGTGDMYFTLLAPGEPYDPFAPAGADDGEGLVGLDPSGTFDIDETGTWRIVVGGYDGVVSGYELTVDRDT